MSAYVIITREKTHDAAELDEYRKLEPASFAQHPATLLAYYGRHEVLEGPAAETVILLEFPTYEDAEAWYHSPAYQEACRHRFQGGDYRCILTEGSPRQ